MSSTRRGGTNVMSVIIGHLLLQRVSQTDLRSEPILLNGPLIDHYMCIIKLIGLYEVLFFKVIDLHN
jgi:hypothetical protein